MCDDKTDTQLLHQRSKHLNKSFSCVCLKLICHCSFTIPRSFFLNIFIAHYCLVLHPPQMINYKQLEKQNKNKIPQRG